PGSAGIDPHGKVLSDAGWQEDRQRAEFLSRICAYRGSVGRGTHRRHKERSECNRISWRTGKSRALARIGSEPHSRKSRRDVRSGAVHELEFLRRGKCESNGRSVQRVQRRNRRGERGKEEAEGDGKDLWQTDTA